MRVARTKRACGPEPRPHRPASLLLRVLPPRAEKDAREEVNDEQPELKGKVAEQAKIIGAKWKALTDAQKAP